MLVFLQSIEAADERSLNLCRCWLMRKQNRAKSQFRWLRLCMSN
uniref:Uncharacterized protein n=1 Tax=Arundo donax TaxID=35708 RepID=A0A0A9FQW2_ARUDO